MDFGRHDTVMFVVTMTIMTQLTAEVAAHGRLMDPPARNSMWRLGFNNPVNYNDNELYCGGRMVQWLRNGGKCGVCGDAYHGQREHEAGGKFANGIVTRTFRQGDIMPITVHLTANHQGWFEVRVCPVNDAKKAVTQDCLDKHVLRRTDGGGVRYPVPKGKYNAFFNYTVQLPPDLTCKQCVVQWKYRTGNTWDKDDNSGVFCLGCGPQEEFYNCADIEILPDKAMKSKVQSKTKLNEAFVERQDKRSKTEVKSAKKLLKNTTNPTTVGKRTRPITTQNEAEVRENEAEVKEKGAQSQKRIEVKGGVGRGWKKPREDSYSWHAASPLSWAIGHRRPAQQPPAPTAAAPTTTKGKNPFTRPPPAARTRTTVASHSKPMVHPLTTTPRPRKRKGERKAVTRPHTMSSSNSTLSPPAARRTSVQRSRAASGSHRVAGMPSWLVRVTNRLKQQQKTAKTAAPQRVRSEAYSMENIEARRQRFRLKLWRHLQRSKQRHRNVTAASSTHRSAVRVASPTEEMSSTKVTPTCVTSAKRSHSDSTRDPQRTHTSSLDSVRNVAPRTHTPNLNSVRSETPRTHTPNLNSVRSETPRTHTPNLNPVRSETPRTHTPNLNSVRSETPRTHTPNLNSVRSETPRTHTPNLNSVRSETPRQTPNLNSVRSDSPPRTSFSHSEDLLRAKGNQYHFARSEFARSDLSRRNSLSRAELPGEKLSMAMFQPLQPLPVVRDGAWRWWRGYGDVMWRRAFVASLQCRATVRLGGGMDDWCTANCNANYCPPAMCVCQRKQDAFSPRYDLVDPASWIRPYKPAVRHTSYRRLAPLQLHIPDSLAESRASSKSIFSPPSSYNTYRSEEAVRAPFVATYSPFAHQPQPQPQPQPRLRPQPQPRLRSQPQPHERGSVEESYGVGGVAGWNRKSMVCRATGHYTGLAHYDNWCSNNCAQAMCPLLMCTCDTF